jgi:hypothetical protein
MQVVVVSETEDLLAVILANPVMIDAYRVGVPRNGSLRHSQHRMKSGGLISAFGGRERSCSGYHPNDRS